MNEQDNGSIVLHGVGSPATVRHGTRLDVAGIKAAPRLSSLETEVSDQLETVTTVRPSRTVMVLQEVAKEDADKPWHSVTMLQPVTVPERTVVRQRVIVERPALAAVGVADAPVERKPAPDIDDMVRNGVTLEDVVERQLAAYRATARTRARASATPRRTMPKVKIQRIRGTR